MMRPFYMVVTWCRRDRRTDKEKAAGLVCETTNAAAIPAFPNQQSTKGERHADVVGGLYHGWGKWDNILRGAL
jgi:hypothetical protein